MLFLSSSRLWLAASLLSSSLEESKASAFSRKLQSATKSWDLWKGVKVQTSTGCLVSQHQHPGTRRSRMGLQEQGVSSRRWLRWLIKARGDDGEVGETNHQRHRLQRWASSPQLEISCCLSAPQIYLSMVIATVVSFNLLEKALVCSPK